MFVPGAHARLHITGIGGPTRRNKNRQKLARRKVGAREILRMPCLLPTVFVVFFGLLILAGGAGMCVLGYIPDMVTEVSDDESNTTTVVMVTKDARYYATKSLSYAGPILMGCGFFAIIVSCVLYCEIIDRYAVLLPNKPQTRLRRREVLDMILSEFKKSYFRGIEVPIRKEPPASQKPNERPMETLLRALSISTPVLLMSPDLAPTPWRFGPHPYGYPGLPRHLALKPRHPKLKQLGGGCGGVGGGGGGGGVGVAGGGGGGVGGGGGGGVGVSGSGEPEAWLKTSSLPNICDPEALPVPGCSAGGSEALRQVAVLDHLQEVVRARRLRRFARPSCSMDGKMSLSLPQALSQSSMGVDNPAYLHEKVRRRSLSICMTESFSARPSASRFVKTSQLQPRERLQQLQQQNIHKQRQLILQQHEEQQQQQHPKVKKKGQRRGSEDSRGGRRRDSDEPRLSKPKPKLAQTRGAHKTFDSSGVTSLAFCPSDPPPFPLPAHFIQTRQTPDSSPTSLSSRTVKLLKAKCQSLDIRDKKKTDVMLLRDLFRSDDVEDSPTSPSPITSQPSTSSLADIDSREQICTDPPTGQPPGNAAVPPHLQTGNTASSQPQIGKKNSAFVRVIPSKAGCKLRSDVDNLEADTHDVIKPKLRASCMDEQRYELPLLSGVARTNRQWEAERRRRIFRESSLGHRSYSLDAKDSGSAKKADTARSSVHRSTSFKSPLAREIKLAPCGMQSLGPPSLAGEKGNSSPLLQMPSLQCPKTRPVSWCGENCPMPAPSIMVASVISPPNQPNSILTSQTSSAVTRSPKPTSSGHSEAEDPSSLYPCHVVTESEQRAGRTKSAVTSSRVHDPQCLKIPARSPHSHNNDLRSADRSTSSQQRPCRHQQQHQQLVVPAQVHPQVSSPKYLDPVLVERTLNQGPQCRNHNENTADKHRGSYELAVERRAGHDPRGSQRDSDSHQQDSADDLSSKQGSPKPCRTEEHPSESHPHQREAAKRRSTIVHRASVHLSLDSYADSSMSITSSTVSSTDNTNSSNVALMMMAPSPTATSLSPCSVGGGDGGSGGGVSGVDGGGRGGGDGGGEGSTQALRRKKFTQSRSVAVEELSGDEEETEDTPLIQTPLSSTTSGTVGKS